MNTLTTIVANVSSTARRWKTIRNEDGLFCWYGHGSRRSSTVDIPVANRVFARFVRPLISLYGACSVRTRTVLLQVSTTRSRRPKRSQLQRLRLTSVVAAAAGTVLGLPHPAAPPAACSSQRTSIIAKCTISDAQSGLPRTGQPRGAVRQLSL